MTAPEPHPPIAAKIRRQVLQALWKQWAGPDEAGVLYFMRLEQIDDLFPDGDCLVYQDEEGFVAVSAADPSIWMRSLSSRCFIPGPALDAAPPFDLHFQD